MAGQVLAGILAAVDGGCPGCQPQAYSNNIYLASCWSRTCEVILLLLLSNWDGVNVGILSLDRLDLLVGRNAIDVHHDGCGRAMDVQKVRTRG